MFPSTLAFKLLLSRRLPHQNYVRISCFSIWTVINRGSYNGKPISFVFQVNISRPFKDRIIMRLTALITLWCIVIRDTRHTAVTDVVSHVLIIMSINVTSLQALTTFKSFSTTLWICLQLDAREQQVRAADWKTLQSPSETINAFQPNFKKNCPIMQLVSRRGFPIRIARLGQIQGIHK